ncbi:MAG: HAD-IIIA family hydrolase [Bacteroidota bacterium]
MSLVVFREEITQIRPDRSWTVFIDRDGVINQKRDNDYVRNWSQFTFIKDSVVGLHVLSKIFGRLIVATNQRGIGRKLMTETDLEVVHTIMLQKIRAGGGKIDRVYHCPHLAEEDTEGCRKPAIGMALKAQQAFPEIQFAQSIMIGDALSDLQFGRNAGMWTDWVSSEKANDALRQFADLQVDSLFTFSNWLNREV